MQEANYYLELYYYTRYTIVESVGLFCEWATADTSG